MDETDTQFDERLCRVIAQAKTTFYEEHYVWKPLGAGKAPSSNALACVADGGAWHEFVSAVAADKDGRFRVVLFKFSETGPSAIGFVAWLHSNLRRLGKTGAIVICEGSPLLCKALRDLPRSDGLLGMSGRSKRRSVPSRHPNSDTTRGHNQIGRCLLVAHREILQQHKGWSLSG